MNYTTVQNPVYADARNRTIDCLVKFEAFPSPVPFTASPDDSTPHNVKILAELKAGKYGAIAPYVGTDGNN